MKTWETIFFENDTALDLACHWDNFVLPCINGKVWSDEKTWIFFKEIYFKCRFIPSNNEQNSELLALAILFNKYGLTINDEFKLILERAVSFELKSVSLDEWNNPTSRENNLLQFLDKFDMKKRKLLKSEMSNPSISIEIKKLLPFVKKIQQMIDTVTIPRSDEDFEKFYPNFFNEIDKLLISNIPTPIEYTEQEMKLINLRVKLLAFYIGWKTRCSKDEILALINNADSTSGYIHFNLDVFGED